tara:strand:- start:381 stop:554 length:174 start_codon:yes stop_codon:yes gene_type:complete
MEELINKLKKGDWVIINDDESGNIINITQEMVTLYNGTSGWDVHFSEIEEIEMLYIF